MFKLLRNSSFTRVFWAFIALYLLNISADTRDSSLSHLPEDLSINDQESIIEIFVEKVLGYKNEIKEYDDPDNGDYNKKKSSKIDLSICCLASYLMVHYLPTNKRYCFISSNRLIKPLIEVDSPPPKFDF